jgi:hypothetical protein
MLMCVRTQDVAPDSTSSGSFWQSGHVVLYGLE